MWYIEPSIRYGRVMPTLKTDHFLWETDLVGAEIRVGKQTTGEKEWEQWFRFPSYGAALRYSYFNRPSLGDEIAILGFLNGYFVQRPKFAFYYQLGAGVGFWTKKYNFYTNPENIFIGAYATAHLDLGLGISARLSDHLDFVLKGVFSHSSNGVLALPNYGINGVTVSAGVKYRFYKQLEPIRNVVDTTTTFVPKNSLYISIAPCVKQSRAEFSLDHVSPRHYCFATTLEIGYLRQFHPKYRYGAGLDLFYNSEILTYFPVEEQNVGKCFMPAAFGSFDVLFNRIVFHVAVGAYIGRYYDFYKPYYERMGVQFLLGKDKNHTVGASIKAHLGRADYIEWNYSYNFYSWNDRKPRIMHHQKRLIEKNSRKKLE